MKPTEILKNEHRVIEQVLNSLQAIVEESAAKGRLEEESARLAVDFFRNFADRCHHGKEEVHLFPWMEAKGFERNNGPTGVMLREHEIGRAHVRGMEEAIAAAAQGGGEALMSFANHANGYIEMLREHIQKEDHCLFSMANQIMSEEDERQLMALFEHVEEEEMEAGTHEKYLRVAQMLAERYQVPPAEVDLSALTCGCHHTH
ncbi:MAG: hemerythrin domain-containing protein [Candidatus Omnitrophota bacterium]